MPRVHYLQSSFVSGVLTPLVASRFDIQQYYQGLSVGRNVLVRPTGGVRRRPGTLFCGQLPGSVVDFDPGTLTAPNGGTAANTKDFDRNTFLETTTTIGTADPYVVIEEQFSSPARVEFVDVLDIELSGGSTDEFRIQYSDDGSAWTNYGEALLVVDDTARDYRRGETLPVTAQYWRLVKVGGSNLGAATVKISGFELYGGITVSAGGFAQSAVKLFPFEFNVDQAYVLAFTDGNIAIYRRLNEIEFKLVTHVRSPFQSFQVESLDVAQTADTAIIVHPDTQPHRLVRSPVEEVWSLEPVTFTDVPQFDYNDSDSPTPVAEVQDIEFRGGTWQQGDTFELELEGARTRSITYAGSGSGGPRETTAENIRRELQLLPTAGASGISVAWQSGEIYRVTFAGASADQYDLMGGAPLSGKGDEIGVTRDTAGSPRSEDAVSSTRGWFNSVAFFDGRLWFGGAKSLPSTVFASSLLDFFSFDTGEGRDDEAIIQTVNSDSLNAIQYIYPGRNLQLFTTGGEARYVEDVLTPANAFPRFQTRYGSAKVRPVTVDGTTVFVQRTRAAVREFVFTLEEEAYLSPPLSTLAGHLVKRVRDMTAWNGSGDDDSNLVYLVNQDGTMAVLQTLRSQDVQAWTEFTTDGTYRSVAAVVEDVFVAVRRSVGAGTVTFLECFDEASRMDAGRVGSVGFTGDIDVGHLEGREVQLWADGYVLDEQEVTGGIVSIDESVFTDYNVGLGFSWKCVTMPLANDFGEGNNFLRKKRMIRAKMYVKDTEAIEFNGRRWYDREYDANNFDDPPAIIDGMVRFDTSSEWVEGPLTVEFGSTVPGKAEVLGMDIQVETE